MSQYDYTNAPAWNANAEASAKGWIDSVTGEVLVAIGDLDAKQTDITDVATFVAVLSGGKGSATVTTTTPGDTGVTSEVQTIVINATGGTFTITFSGQTTTPLAYNASTATVQAALWALSNIADNDVAVTGTAGNYTLTWLDSLGDVAEPTVDIASLQGGVTFVTGDVLRLTVTASEAVVVTGRPTIDLDINGVTRTAIYQGSLSTSTSLVFTYTIVGADEAAAGEFETAVAMVGGIIADAFPDGGSQPIGADDKVFSAITTTSTTIN